MQPDQVISDYQQRMQTVAAKAQAVQAQIAALRGVETSSDGAVTVSVNVQGGVEKLSFGPAASELPLDALATLIVATSRKARVRAAKAAAEAVEPIIGANSPAMDELRARLPIDASLDEVVDRPERGGLNEEQVEQAPTVTPPVPAQQSRPPSAAHRAYDDDDIDDAGTGYTRGG